MTAGQVISTPVTRARVAEMADAWQSDWIEAVVDIRPRDGNRSRGVDDPERRARIRRVVESLVVN